MVELGIRTRPEHEGLARMRQYPLQSVACLRTLCLGREGKNNGYKLSVSWMVLNAVINFVSSAGSAPSFRLCFFSYQAVKERKLVGSNPPCASTVIDANIGSKQSSQILLIRKCLTEIAENLSNILIYALPTSREKTPILRFNTFNQRHPL
jgi:hypothetical protein